MTVRIFFNYNVLSKVEPVEDDATIDDRRLCKLKKKWSALRNSIKIFSKVFHQIV